MAENINEVVVESTGEISSVVFAKDGSQIRESVTRNNAVRVWPDKTLLLQTLETELSRLVDGIAKGRAIVDSYTAEKTKIEERINEINNL